MKLTFATRNQHKVEEVSTLLNSNFELQNLDEIGFLQETAETGKSFKENAFIKAKAVYDFELKPVFSDDSGLVVPALNGEPGIDSAHYSGSRDSQKNIDLLLSNLRGIHQREAFFISVFCLIYKGNETFFEGVVHGSISSKALGEKGFGYDPVFVPDGFTQSFAQLGMKEKNKLSHRTIAVRKLNLFLQSL